MTACFFYLSIQFLPYFYIIPTHTHTLCNTKLGTEHVFQNIIVCLQSLQSLFERAVCMYLHRWVLQPHPPERRAGAVGKLPRCCRGQLPRAGKLCRPPRTPARRLRVMCSAAVACTGSGWCAALSPAPAPPPPVRQTGSATSLISSLIACKNPSLSPQDQEIQIFIL